MSDRIDIQNAGQAGVIYETGTTVLTSLDVAKITILEAATFTTLTNTLATGDALTGFVIPAGIDLYGKFTAVTLTSGKIAMYKAAPLA